MSVVNVCLRKEKSPYQNEQNWLCFVVWVVVPVCDHDGGGGGGGGQWSNWQRRNRRTCSNNTEKKRKDPAGDDAMVNDYWKKVS